MGALLDRSYQRNLVRAGERYHLWVLCWGNGQRSPIHDHTGSACAVRIIEGTATVTLFDRGKTATSRPSPRKNTPRDR